MKKKQKERSQSVVFRKEELDNAIRSDFEKRFSFRTGEKKLILLAIVLAAV